MTTVVVPFTGSTALWDVTAMAALFTVGCKSHAVRLLTEAGEATTTIVLIVRTIPPDIPARVARVASRCALVGKR